MRTFTIENDNNNITIHASAAEAEAVLDTERFASVAELASLAANWPSARLVDVWNSLTGVTLVKKFQTRAIGVSRIWKAIQGLGDALPPAANEQPETEPQAEATSTAAEVPAPAAPQTPDVAPEGTPATNDATPQTDAPAPASDEKLLRLLGRAFAGLTPEQSEAKWEALKTALATLPAETIKGAKTGAPREAR